MIVGRQNIISWYQTLQVPYWSLYYKGKVDSGNPVYRSSTESNATVTDSVTQLRDALDLLARGAYTLIAHDKEKTSSRGGFRVDFEIPSPESQPGAPAPAPFVAGMPQSLDELDKFAESRAERVVKQVKLEMQLEKLQEQNEELRKENKELQKAADSGTGRFWDAINGIGLDRIIAAFVPQQPAPQVSGIPHVAEPPENDVMTERLSRVLSVFQEHDPQWLDTLEAMANRIQKDPSVLKMFKKFL